MLLEAFKSQGNKRGKPIHLHKFKKALEEVHKQNTTPTTSLTRWRRCSSLSLMSTRVDVEEFLHEVSVFGSLASEEYTKEQKARMVFAVIDRDNSGKICKVEFRRYLSKTVAIATELYFAKAKKEGVPFVLRVGMKVALDLGEGHRTDQITEEAFKADTDGDGDGEISLDEWLTATPATTWPSRPSSIPEIRS